MYLRIGDVLEPAMVAAMRERLADPGLFRDGRATAGRHAQAVKRNLQAAPGDMTAAVLEKVETALLGHPVFRAAARPKRLVRLLVSRYEPGMTYGSHVDEALMDGVRCDLSFTLFLADPASYAGGELVIEEAGGERAFKLPAGELVLYPSTTLHRVEPVREGVRLAVVGWVRSLVRAEDRREILFDLENVLHAVFEKDGKTPVFDLLAKTRTNLLRLWAED
jgi:PKHD-type hydroxylase